jgi:kynurenine 3-monooxygenase
MVTFSRLPYAVALARGNIQSDIVQMVCAGKTSLDQIDLAHADALIAQRLDVLG